MTGICWRLSTWYNNDPNRYSQILSPSEWNFSKKLIEMKENDIVCLTCNPNIQFNVKVCKKENNEFCKILERV